MPAFFPRKSASVLRRNSLQFAGLIPVIMLLLACVVSTQEGVGSPPNVPLKPQLVSVPTVIPQGGPYKISARHILISYQGATKAAAYVKRTREEALALAQSLRLEALAGNDFGKLAEKNSDDRGSAARQGELGNFKREDMVPSFSDAAFALEIDGISEVVESQFGFHVIQRLE